MPKINWFPDNLMVTGAIISTHKSVGSGFDCESVAFPLACWTVRVHGRGNVNLGMED